MGQGVASGDITHLNGFFLPPGSYLVDIRGPQTLPNPPNDDAVLMLVGDVTVPDPIEALLNMGNTPKVGVGIVLFFREALETTWQPLHHRDNVKVLNPGEPSLKYRQSP